jgi:hypothetical protein
MKALFAMIIATAVLYTVDQEYASGQYTQTAELMIGQIRQSIGI